MKEQLLRKIIILVLTAAAIIALALPVLTGSAKEAVKTESESDMEKKIELLIKEMTLEQKVGQMFFCAFRWNTAGRITKIDSNIEKTIKDYNIGGIVLFSENVQTEKQVTDFINGLQKASDIALFIGVDEEGGRVLRTRSLNVPRVLPAFEIGKTGDVRTAYNAGKIIADYLKPLGFNVNFAPTADVLTNPSNKVIGDRAFSSDAVKAGNMVKHFVGGLLDNGILPTLKHFPGHGHTSEDSHYGMAITRKTLEQMSKCEFIPFKEGIDAGAAIVMTGHISTSNVGDGDIPATFSSVLLQEVLRDTLGFEGIIITDALNMGAIVNYYTSEEAAVKSILAGADMLLMPQNLGEAYNGIIKAVKAGKITEKRIEESVKRIITAKCEAGLIKLP